MGRLSVFDENSLFGRICVTAGNVILINLMLVVTLLPVITAGAGICAASYCMLCQVRYGDIVPLRDFMKALRENWKRATAGWLLFLAGEGFFFTDQRIAGAMAASVPAAGWLCRCIAVAAMMAILLVTVWFFPVAASFEGNMKQLLRYSFGFCVRHLLSSMLMAGLAVIPLFVTMVMREWLPLGAFLWCFFGFAFLLWIGAHLQLRAFRPYLTQTPAEEAAADERRVLEDLKRMGG